jgi:hypothetical protein
VANSANVVAVIVKQRAILWNIPAHCLTLTLPRIALRHSIFCAGGEHEAVTACHFNSVLLTADGGGANPASAR